MSDDVPAVAPDGPGAIVEDVPAALAGERIDRVVAIVADRSRAVARRMVEQGAVHLDGRAVSTPATKVEAGQRLAVVVAPDTDPAAVADPSVPVVVVHEDDDVVVVDKAAGVVVHPGAGHESGTLVSGLLARYPELAGVGEPHRPGIVHRLDRGTSGLLVVARTAEAHAALVEAMARHEPERLYTALVWGRVEADRGTVDAPIGRSVRHPTRMTVTERGRRAVTHYEVIARHEEPTPTTLLRCRLETGRTHQIRVHLRAIGHPVVGDRDYDGGRPGLDAGRPFLHAGELRFAHPVTGRPVVATSPLPADLEAVLAACR